MSIERSFLRNRNYLEKVFGKKDRDRNEDGKRKIPLMGNRFLLEPLEPRVLLSNDLIHAAAAGAALDLTLRMQKVDDVDILQLVNNADQSVVESQALADTSAVNITGADLDDKLTIDFSNPFSVPVTFTDASARDSDTLKVIGRDHAWDTSGPNGGSGGR